MSIKFVDINLLFFVCNSYPCVLFESLYLFFYINNQKNLNNRPQIIIC